MYQTKGLDTRLLKNPDFVSGLGQLAPSLEGPVVLYHPPTAVQVAKGMQDFILNLQNPNILRTEFLVAVKAMRELHCLFALFKSGKERGGGVGADVASIGEVDMCLSPFFKEVLDPGMISYSNTSQGRWDMEKAVSKGITRFVVGSQEAIEWLAAASKPGKDPLQIILRVALKSASADQARHGFQQSELAAAATLALANGMEVQGLGYHVGTQNGLPYARNASLAFQAYANAVKEIADVRDQLIDKKLIGLVLDIEGGLRESVGPLEFSVQSILRSISDAIMTLNHPVSCLILEPGRPLNITGGGLVRVCRSYSINGFPAVVLDLTVHNGYDLGYLFPRCLRLTDVQEGNVFDPVDNPNKFRKGYVFGNSCSGSDIGGGRDANLRFNSTLIDLPVGLKAGDIVVLYPLGSYVSSFSPQSMQMVQGRFVGPEKGFNGLPHWQDYALGTPDLQYPSLWTPVQEDNLIYPLK